MRAAESNGVQAAETTTPVRASARDGRARTRSTARAANGVEETTSNCMQNDAAADTRTAAHSIAEQTLPRSVDGDREK